MIQLNTSDRAGVDDEARKLMIVVNRVVPFVPLVRDEFSFFLSFLDSGDLKIDHRHRIGLCARSLSNNIDVTS